MGEQAPNDLKTGYDILPRALARLFHAQALGAVWVGDYADKWEVTYGRAFFGRPGTRQPVRALQLSQTASLTPPCGRSNKEKQDTGGLVLPSSMTLAANPCAPLGGPWT